MRVQLRRATSIHLLIALLGSTAVGQVRAAEAGIHDPWPALPAHAGPIAFGPVIPLPDLPPLPAELSFRPETTGSIPSPPDLPHAPAGDPSFIVPPVLSFDDQAGPGEASASPSTTVMPFAPPGADAGEITRFASPEGPAGGNALPTEPARSDPADATAADAKGTDRSGAGLDAAMMGSALQTFAMERVPAESTAQAGERTKVRAAVAAFYAAHQNAPLWVADGRLTPAARTALSRLDHAAEDGLDLRRFTVPVPRSSDTAALAAAELALTEAVVMYGRQASGSRVDVARLGGLIDLRPAVADVDRILAAVPLADDPGEALRAFNPPQAGYLALKDKLAELRQTSAPEAQTRIPPGPVLKPGMSDARVPLIRARFGLDVASVEPGVPQLVYDTKVAAAVAEFQRGHGLPASGLLTPRTIAALSGGNPSALEHDIIANMELWRWLPRDLGPDHIEVNIPDYTAEVIRDGAVVHQTRVVVGQPDKPTPVFAQTMKFIIVNPYWNVPLSIIKSEMMPKLASDPNYFANHGYEVIERNGTTYVRQPPGDGNALGRIKFMFPNDHAVYLHDTNARSYFGRDKRALSHGCVRVEQPFSFAEAVMGPSNGWTEARIRRLIGGEERTINLSKPLPIFITYFTAFVDPQTGFHLRDDVYGYAKRVKVALGLQD